MQLFGGRERQTPPQNALGEFAGPKLHFRRTKQILGIKQIPYEHLIIPFAAQPPEIQNITGALVDLRAKRNFNPTKYSLRKWQTAIKIGHDELKDKLLRNGTINAKAIFQLENGKLIRLENTNHVQTTLQQMTEGVVDNNRGIELIRHPLDGVAKAQTARERWENLRKWIQWHHPFQRYRFELRPPRRYERETAAKLAAKLTPAKILAK